MYQTIFDLPSRWFDFKWYSLPRNNQLWKAISAMHNFYEHVWPLEAIIFFFFFNMFVWSKNWLQGISSTKKVARGSSHSSSRTLPSGVYAGETLLYRLDFAFRKYHETMLDAQIERMVMHIIILSCITIKYGPYTRSFGSVREYPRIIQIKDLGGKKQKKTKDVDLSFLDWDREPGERK